MWYGSDIRVRTAWLDCVRTVKVKTPFGKEVTVTTAHCGGKWVRVLKRYDNGTCSIKVVSDLYYGPSMA